MKLAIFFLAAICASGQSGLDRPRLGLMIDSTRAARPVYGLPGSLSAEDPAASDVVSLGCGSFCLIKTDTSLLAPGVAVAAPPGPALFAFDSTGAFVYFEKTRQLSRWQSGALSPVDFQIDGDIISLRSAGGAPQFAVRFAEQVQIESDGNAILDSLPPGVRAVLLLPSGEVYATAHAVVLRRADASETAFPLTGAASFTAMAPDYVEVRTAAAIFALRTTPGREQLFQLPEPRP